MKPISGTKQPKLKYVKFVPAKGNLYAYFNTGKKVAGRLVWAKLPPPTSPDFFTSYAAMLGARTKSTQRVQTITDLVAAYERSQDFKQLAAASKRLYTFTLKRVLEHLGKFPVEGVERRHIREILTNRMNGNGSRNVFLAVVGIIYKWARDNDLADRHAMPTEGIKHFPIGQHEPWPEELLEAALSASHDRVRLAVNLLYYTGQRIGDIMKLRWSDIRNGRLVMTQQKTGKALHIPLHSALVAELSQTKKAGLTIMTSWRGQPLHQGVIRDELKAFGVEHGHEVVPHGLRKNAVNALLEAGCTVHEVMAITGQSARIVEHYARRVDQHRLGEAAILKMERSKNFQTEYKTGVII